jgi:hypothetical protein
MNVEIVGTEAAQFPQKKYINGIFHSVHCAVCMLVSAGLKKRGFLWKRQM